MLNRHSFLLIGIVLIASGIAFAYRQTITLPNGATGVIDWSEGTVQAVGMAVAPSNVRNQAQGEILARRGAILDAQRMLVEMLNGVSLDAETTMMQAMANDVVRSRVQGSVQGAVVTSQVWDGSIYTVGLQIPLTSLRQTLGRGAYQAPQADQPTGLIIDARDLNLTPALYVRVLDESGAVVMTDLSALYDPALPSLGGAKGEDAVKRATTDERVGARPMVILAIGVSGNRIDIIVSQEDGLNIKSIVDEGNPFNEGNTIIIAN